MIRIYEKTDTARTAGSLGLCSLPDFASCVVTEERNGEYYLEAEYPTDGQNAKEIMVDRLLSAKPNRVDDPEHFRIAKVEPNLDGMIKITAYHHSYDLKHIVSERINLTQSTASNWLNSYFINALPATKPTFVFQSDTPEVSTNLPAVDHPMSVRQIMAGMEGSILDIYGGEYKYNGVFVKLCANRGKDTGKKIIYGVNMISLNQEISSVDACYGMYPYYRSDSGVVVGDPVMRTVSTDSYAAPFEMMSAVDLTEIWDGVHGRENVPTKAMLDVFSLQRWPTIESEPTVSMDVDYIELTDSPEYAFLNSGNVGLCDTVTVVHPQSGLNIKSKIVKTVYNVLSGRYDAVVIGTIKKNLIDLLRRIK